MNGLGGLNKSPEGVVIGLVQLQLPVVVTKEDLARQATESFPWWARRAAISAPWTSSCSRNTRCTAVDGHQSRDHVPSRRSGSGGVQEGLYRP